VLAENYRKTVPGGIDGDELLANCGLGIVTINVVLILIAALFPFDFDSRDNSSITNLVSRFYGWGDLYDWLQNILLFIPFGFSLASLMQKATLKQVANSAGVLIVSAGLSVTVEISQLFLPGRFPAFVDIIANAAGGLTGFFCFRLSRSKIRAWLVCLAKHRHQYFSFNRLTGTLIAYFVVACLVSFIAATRGALDMWGEDFPLLIGNERTGDRPWVGSISELSIADHAIPQEDVERAFSEAGYWHTLGDSLMGYYRLSGRGSYQDQAGNLPDLSWRISEGLKKQEGQLLAEDYSTRPDLDAAGVFLSSKRWLETTTPPTFMIDSIRKTSQFTLSMKVAAAEIWQHGPARILSLSENPYVRNLTIGQDKADLIFRIRTRLTGHNGSSPELIVPNVFTDTSSHRILVVYDGRYFRVYIDDVDRSFSLEMVDVAIMNPGVMFKSLFSSALPHYFAVNLSLINTFAYKILYLALVFLPMGAVVGLITLIMRGRLRTFGPLAVIWILLPAITLEWVFASARTSGMEFDNIIISLTISTTAMLLFRLWATTWLFNQFVLSLTDADFAPTAH
jgi:VanZ family protein